MTEVTGRKAWLYGDRQVPGPVLAPPYLQRPADAMEDTMPRQAASTNIPAGFTKNPVIARRAVVLALDCQAALLRGPAAVARAQSASPATSGASEARLATSRTQG